jgi:hypothetical protein
MHSVLDRPLRASCFYMAETTSVPRFERIRDPQRSIVIHSYCLTCGLFVAANEDGYIVLRAEMAHSCQPGYRFVSHPPLPCCPQVNGL